jgi:hypothetical protein
MADMEGAEGWGETPAGAYSYDSVGDGMPEDGRVSPGLGLSAAEAAEAALIQDEIDYAAHMALSEEAAMRHFGKDPRDML